MAHPSPPTAALLYSPQSRNPDLLRLLDQIKDDPILSKGIRLISVDSPYVKEQLRGNESGVAVKKWPIFAIKGEKDRTPTLYPVSSYEEVFKLVRSAGYRTVREARHLPIERHAPPAGHLAPPAGHLAPPRTSLNFIQRRSAPPIDRAPPLNSTCAPSGKDCAPPAAPHIPSKTSLNDSAPPGNNSAPPGLGRLISWDSGSFSGEPISMIVSEGSSIRFLSEDEMVHDVTLADASWKPIRRLIPRQKKIDQKLVIDGQLVKAAERGRCHLISSLPQDRQMRLALRLTNPIDEIISGISEVDDSSLSVEHHTSPKKDYSSSGREFAPPGRQFAPPGRQFAPPGRRVDPRASPAHFAPRRTWKFITEEREEPAGRGHSPAGRGHSSEDDSSTDWNRPRTTHRHSGEKSGPSGLRTNPIVARVHVPSEEPPSEKEAPAPPVEAPTRTTFAQRRLAKLQ